VNTHLPFTEPSFTILKATPAQHSAVRDMECWELLEALVSARALRLCYSVKRFFPTLIMSCSLLKDLLNFDDPLNIEAAEHHLRDKVS
jgi:hypothetical protein